MCFEKRFSFSPRHLGLLTHVRESLEACGHTCHVEVTFEGHGKFELHTLVAVPPKKEHPVIFTRATEEL
jgi:hypothetical protein